MLKKLKKLYIDEQLNPKFIGLFINPFYFARKGLYKHVSELIRNLNGKVLDIGCGQKPYQNLCICTEYIGLEIYTPQNRQNKKADFFYDGKNMPFGEDLFDSIISNQVFEHVFNPNEFLRETNRVLKMDGVFLITVPFVWDEHEQPYDYARYSSFGLKHILSDNGFEIIEHRKSNNGIEVIFQLLNDYIYKITVTKNGYLNLIITLFLIAPFNIVGLFLSKILPKNDDLYLDNIVLAKKIKNV
ncbi:class I SAM-dependent methyltransferase [Sulfurimonas sp. RIFOXYB12_FULL_35_9]|uniref:class I SAM-dependent methyltransferase n=1 Tax=Sulfurimonas sp. RIFOXYB12_FULL_35_9 TaxID=1802256 RepID=UPI0008B475FE|nr:class I SAM-dependent methyltransferase [Sulfurimonas sp. RIFOXYB12_FULL_35_9]OHE05340.1 MAG: methylase [Sulfurimonas sp. RIFOXYB12_FULL_35_9]